MVLAIQEGRNIRLFFFNGYPKVSWNYTDGQLSLDRVGNAIIEGPPVGLVLKSGGQVKFAESLRAKFSKCDSTVGPLWKLDPGAWDYQVMKLQHQYDLGIRISFGLNSFTLPAKRSLVSRLAFWKH